MKPTVVVIGGGFAGVGAACRLAGDGHDVLLLERAPRLGGRAASVYLRDVNEVVDVGQHVLMRCCTATQGFLLRIKAASAVRFQPELSVPMVHRGRVSTLRSSLLPGPLHLAPSLLAYRPLPVRERLAVLRAGFALLIGGRRRGVRFADWLRAHGQHETAIERLWDPICIATLNASAGDVSVRAARQVFHEGILRREGAGLGLFTKPLGEVFTAARRYIEDRSGAVRTSAGVRRILVHRGIIRGVELSDGETIEAPVVIVAIPPWDVGKVLPDWAAVSSGDASKLVWAPIVNVHLWFDRPVMEHPFLTVVDSPVQTVFDVTGRHAATRSRSGESDPLGRGLPESRRADDIVGAHVVLSQSAAASWIDRPINEVFQELFAALGDVLPTIREARLVHRLVIRRPRATFVPSPGSTRLRPVTKTSVQGLYLAGDWTATGWPSTIEGAIRSGIFASARAERDLGNEVGSPHIVPDSETEVE